MMGETKKILKKLVCTGIVIIFMTVSAKATHVNSNSIVVDGIEYYMQTDKSVYRLSENVKMLYRLTNLSYSSVTFEFANLQQWSFEVKDGTTTIWRWPKPFFPALSSFTLYPGDVKGYLKKWDMMNDNTGTIVSPGTYGVIGALFYCTSHGYVPVSVQIEIVEGPYCGDTNHPYPAGDVNHDCKVNLLDMATLAFSWLECTALDC